MSGRLDLLQQLRVEQQLVLLVGTPQFGPPKTASSRRIVPLPAAVVDVVAAHLHANGAGDHDLVFTDENGAPIRRNRFSAKVWRPAVKTSKMPDSTHVHDLRHYYASLLIHAGESVKTVQARLGHASAIETLDTYGHLWPDSEDRTRQAVDDAFSLDISEENGDSLGTVHTI